MYDISMGSKLIVVIVLLIMVLGGGYYLARSIKHAMVHPSGQTVQPTTMQKATAGSVTTAPTGQQITIVGTEFSFNPSAITVTKGQPVTITFKNEGAYPHNFTLSDLQVNTKTIQPGETDTVTFTPDKTGSFSYVCTVPGHADKGMKGTLTVQ